jgi:hypothetical protein
MPFRLKNVVPQFAGDAQIETKADCSPELSFSLAGLDRTVQS